MIDNVTEHYGVVIIRVGEHLLERMG